MPLYAILESEARTQLAENAQKVDSMWTQEQECGNGMGMRGKLREEYRVSSVSTGLGP